MAWLFEKSGIAWVVKKINPDCGCDRRRKKLNNLMGKKEDEVMTTLEMGEFERILPQIRKGRVRGSDVGVLETLYAKYVPGKVPPRGCSSCSRELVNKLSELYLESLKWHE